MYIQGWYSWVIEQLSGVTSVLISLVTELITARKGSPSPRPHSIVGAPLLVLTHLSLYEH